MRNDLAIITTVALAAAIGAAACDEATAPTTGPEADAPGVAASSGGSATHVTADVFQWCKLVDLNAFGAPVPCLLDASDPGLDVGDATLRRTADGFTWQLRVYGMTPGHAYTVWVGNADGIVPPADPTDPADRAAFEAAANALDALFDFGHGAGGLVGTGHGQVIASGNQCVDALAFELTDQGLVITSAGFDPGTPPDCDFVRLDEPLWLFLIDHGPWRPGDMANRWTFFGGIGELYAFFPAPA